MHRRHATVVLHATNLLAAAASVRNGSVYMIHLAHGLLPGVLLHCAASTLFKSQSTGFNGNMLIFDRVLLTLCGRNG